MKRITTLVLSLLFIVSTSNLCFFAETDNEHIDKSHAQQFAESQSSYSQYAAQFTNEQYSNNTFKVPVSNFTGVKKTDSSGNEYSFLEPEKEIICSFNVPASGLYALNIAYTFDFDGAGTEPVSLTLKANGKIPYSEAEGFTLSRGFCDSGEKRSDNYGNEIAKKVEAVTGVQSAAFENAFNGKELLIYFEAGSNSISFCDASDYIGIVSLSFTKPVSTIGYSDYLSQYQNSGEYSGEQIIFEAEDASVKNRGNIIQLSDDSSANVYPSNPSVNKINYIGGSNWGQPGETISWEISVPKDGLYNIGLNYRQNQNLNSVFYRELRIDGALPFSEASEIQFDYALDWKFKKLSSPNGDPYFFYLSAGKHTLSLTVRLGPLSKAFSSLESITYDLAALYRNIVMITGDSPDANRDYNLFERVENMESRIDESIASLTAAAAELESVFENESVSAISTVNSMISSLKLMKEHKYTAHRYISRYYDSYASLSSMAMDLSSMPLDVDRIYLGKEFKDTKTGIFPSVVFSVKRFLHSFANEYAVSKTGERKVLTLWVNWGRDQAKVLKYLIQSDFSAKHNIDVDIKITNATLTHAALSGNGPDAQLHLSRSEPVNLAMRGAVCDLTEFPDYNEVGSRFMKGADNCYKFGDGVYALPDTQTFYMMFVRKDIFEELGLAIPKTWEEFIDTSVILLRQNMQVGLPYTQIAEMTQVNLGAGALSIYPTLLIQSGGKLYNDKLSQTQLLSDLSIQSFVKWTEFYSKYGFPKTYDFFNRFRLGLMPIAIQNYTMYATLSAAAPEISDSWEMYEIPGTVTENGIVNILAGGGTGSVILSDSKLKNEAWELIKWWTSKDVQLSYGTEVENILGEAARVATSNTEALKGYSWKKFTLENIVSQWEKVEELPEVPGGYYVSRVIDQAFWNVVNAGENPKDMLMEWNRVAQTEIDRKREQYNIK